MKSPMIAIVDIKDDQQVVKKYKAGLPTSQPATPTAKQPEQNMVEQAFEGEPAAPTQRPW
jgi:hypothetical protein